MLVHILHFIELHDVPSVANTCRRLHEPRAKYAWHAFALLAARGDAYLNDCLYRLMGSEQSASAARLPRPWPALLASGASRRHHHPSRWADRSG